MPASKKTSRPVPKHNRAKRPRGMHSEFLKRFHGEPLRQDPANSLQPEPAAAPKPALAAQPELKKNVGAVPEFEAFLKVTSRTAQTRVVEQRVTYAAGPGQPWTAVELRLTTALRGRRETDGLAEGAFLFRLEILKATPGCKVAGFSLGPWQAEHLELEQGNVFIAEPLWAGFAAQAGTWRGRVLLYDTKRKHILDLPWNTEALVPGSEPL